MSSTRTRSLLAAAALACCATAQASAVLSFEDPVDLPLFVHGDTVTQGMFSYQAQNFSNDTSGLSGAIVDGSDPGTCATVSCPTNNATHYYAALNDGILRVRLANGQAFRLSSFLASFLGASGEQLPSTSGLLFVEADRADGSFAVASFSLAGPTAGQLGFSGYRIDDASYPGFGGTGTLNYEDQYTQLFFFGFACNSAGNCSAGSTNRAQFALDNINVIPVPEPASLLLVATALGGLGLASRRRRSLPAA